MATWVAMEAMCTRAADIRPGCHFAFPLRRCQREFKSRGRQLLRLQLLAETGLDEWRAVALAYNGLGQLVAKTANGVTTQYLVDDLSPTGYPQVVAELVNGQAVRTYTYGLERISELQKVNSTLTTSFYQYNGRGTVRLLTNSAAAVTDTYVRRLWQPDCPDRYHPQRLSLSRRALRLRPRPLLPARALV